jgi:hypothetical protein
MEHKVYLSRRNVQTLLNKLDRVKAGDSSACTLIKYDNQHAKYPQTMVACRVTAVEGAANLPGDENQIFLSREDLTSLLTGLDGVGNALLISSGITVFVLEDKEYYTTREPGVVYSADDPGVK